MTIKDNNINKEKKNLKKELDNLTRKIKSFEDKKIKEQTILKEPKNKNIALIYNIFADLLGGVLTAFILYKFVYCNFFGKNNLVFVILLICCSMAGLYNTIRLMIKKM